MEDVLPSENWTAVSLRISSRDLTCAEITEALRLKPTECFEKGTPASPRNPNSYRREAAIWLLASGLGDDRDATEHFEALLQQIEPRRAELESLRSSCTVEFFVGFSSDNGQGGFVLPAELCSRIGKLPIALSLDLYPPSGTK